MNMNAMFCMSLQDAFTRYSIGIVESSTLISSIEISCETPRGRLDF